MQFYLRPKVYDYGSYSGRMQNFVQNLHLEMAKLQEKRADKRGAVAKKTVVLLSPTLFCLIHSDKKNKKDRALSEMEERTNRSFVARTDMDILLHMDIKSMSLKCL